MANLFITNGFEKLADAELETRSYGILNGVRDNAVYFPAPKPTTVEMEVIIGDFFTALDGAKDGDRLKIAIKNQKRQAVIDALHLWGPYVLSQAGGDPVIALASNFSLRKTPANRPPIAKPENFKIIPGANPLELAGSVNKVAGANTYLFQCAKDEMMAQDNWLSAPSSSTKCIITGLESGIVYNCRVLAIGPRNQVMYSDVLRCRVA